ncbi:PP2C family serine/threonine-protein phosphatase [Fictibacillus sp. NRS-1165]|uniref:PP2C family serine/threonine-protein phosphatase n=1 Tax=Fictibacillus sp. NRS-1165 TaxID=3144463 RepID=UPI003D20F298
MYTYYSDQKKETPVSSVYRDPFSIRYGYARSSETQEADDSGQDFLAFEVKDRTLVFAVCDGVSLSFCGDLAARFLSEKLIRWLGELPADEFNDEAAVKEKLAFYLAKLTEEGTETIRKHRLPASMPPILREVLEEKRTKGSETMFICGRIGMADEMTNQARVFLASSGDIRLRIWDSSEEVTAKGEMMPETKKRWSTKDGLIGGDIHTVTGQSLGGVHRIAVYSDGLSVIDGLKQLPTTDQLQILVKKSLQSPLSDDLSFLDIAW